MSLLTGSSWPGPQNNDPELGNSFVSSKPMLLQDPDADTLVYLGVPPQQVDQTPAQYKAMQKHWGNFQRVHSDRIFSIQSSKLDKLMAPTMQFKTERRWRNAGILPMKPQEIKYLLDLRPPGEGDDAVLLVSQLTCSDGILRWAAAKQKIEIPANLIDGQDEFVILSKTKSKTVSDLPSSKEDSAKEDSDAFEQPTGPNSPSKRKSEDKQSKPRQVRRKGNWQGNLPKPSQENDTTQEDEQVQTPKTESIEQDSQGEETEQVAVPPASYSQIRHWSALERFLHAIEGKDPMLDSAPKLWTFFSIANYFGCAQHERIRGWILAWLWTSPNWNFIQCNPEVSYRIGMGVQSLYLVRTAYALLVGEKTMMDITCDNQPGPKQAAKLAPTGRFLEDLDEDEQTRIDHAAVAVRDRFRAVYNDLVGHKMLWLNQSKHFKRVLDFQPSKKQDQKTLSTYLDNVRDFVRSRIVSLMASNYDVYAVSRFEDHVHLIKPFYSGALGPYSQYNGLPEQERAFTRLFWASLKSEKLTFGDSVFIGSTNQPSDSSSSSRTVGSDLLITIKQEERWRLKVVTQYDLGDSGLMVQKIIERPESHDTSPSIFGAEHKTTKEIQLPIRTTASADTFEDLDLQQRLARLGSTFVEDFDHQKPQTSSSTDRPTAETTAQRVRFRLPGSPHEEPAGRYQEHPDPDPPLDDFGLVLTPKNNFLKDHGFTIHLLQEVETELQKICTTMLSHAYCTDGNEDIPITLIPHLVCLTDDEWKYLPLWAGGNDDASGGVFNDHVVPADMDGEFSGGLRGLGGSGGGIGGSGVGSAFSESSGFMSTVGAASRRADHGTATGTNTENGSVVMLSDNFDIRSLPDSVSVAGTTDTMDTMDTVDTIGASEDGSVVDLGAAGQQEVLGASAAVEASDGTHAQTHDLSDDDDENDDDENDDDDAADEDEGWDMVFDD